MQKRTGRAIAFYEGAVKHIYFVAETKDDISPLELREIEKAKAHCARKHFRAISGERRHEFERYRII